MHRLTASTGPRYLEKGAKLLHDGRAAERSNRFRGGYLPFGRPLGKPIVLLGNLQQAFARVSHAELLRLVSRPLSARHGIYKDRSPDHVMLPGMKHRIVMPDSPLIGHTIALPTRFGSVSTASSGTTIHSLSMRTRK